MNKSRKFLIIPLLVPALLGCSTAKMKEPKFKNKGILVNSDYFYTKLENRLADVDWFLNTDNVKQTSNLKMTFRIQYQTRYITSKPLSYTVYNDLTGKLLYDTKNLRFRLDMIAKSYVENNIRGSDLSDYGIQEGASYKKSRLYGEQLNDKVYIYDLDYMTIDDGDLDLLPNGVPSPLDSIYSLGNISLKDSNVQTHINNNKIFTINSAYSYGSSYQVDETYQLVFSNDLRILLKETAHSTNAQQKQTTTIYIDAKLKPYKSSINKIYF